MAEEAGPVRRGKTIEQIYQKKSQLEHILLRPDTYVGSTEHQQQEMFIFDQKKGEIVYRKIDYVPALYKIYDEILVNSADNSMRDPKGMDLIDITIDQEAGSVSVMNSGKGIPVVIHKEHKCYVPEMIFGQLLTGDNYDDNERKVTGGRNGFGAKLTNVFSKKFIVETADCKEKKKCTVTWENNMSKKSPPKISPYPAGKDYTRVTFWPDFEKFGMKKLDDDIVGLFMKRAYDVAGSTNHKVKVNLNGKKLPVSTFEEYIKLYVNQQQSEIVYEKCTDRWEVAFCISDNGFQQCSFVNSINSIKGGTHVAHITDQLVEAILKVVKSKNKGGIEIKPQHVKNHLFVFVNALIENPAFDSQTKEALTTKQSKFGSTCELPEKLLKQVLKSGVVDAVLDWARAKQKVDMGRQLKGGTKNLLRVTGIPKLEDANDAGGKDSQGCTLILTEGDSAKALAVAGLSIVGRDRYGVFPLKGKVLNVRDANFKQVTENKEIQALLKIVGLDIKREYDSTKGLRYGSISLMTDQDHDGSHIKGLLINLVHHWWPGLLQLDGFLKEFVTPIVKVWKEGKKDHDRKDEKCFFTLNEFQKWKKRSNDGKGWRTKYYKGLGTSTSKEAKEYFRDIENHEIKFKYEDDQDGECIDLAFNKKRADDRKEWINNYKEGAHVDHSQTSITYHDFVHKELVQFAKYDVGRSIPSVVDGFKPSQRKVMFCAFKKKLKNDIKVAQFVGYVSEQSAYHHGEVSLENTIINLAQNFVGSNNVNLLFPSGQFGTRLQGGKDHAASRYIFTRMCQVTRIMFHPDDDAVLKYLDDEGQSIEPVWYCPILPLVLVNGADGIGVGWSTFIPNFNPRDIVRNIRKMLRGEKMEDMTPWFKGFKGTITSNKENGFDVIGVLEKTSNTTVVISELPIRKWTQAYKEWLEEIMPSQEGKKGEEDTDALIQDYREYHTENTVHFEITMSAEKMKEAEKMGLEKFFKIKTTIPISNMVLFDAEGKIAKYNSALDILTDFCKLRRTMYDERKGHMVAKLLRDQQILSNKARFILMVVKGELELRKRKKVDLLKELEKKGFAKMCDLDAILTKRGAALDAQVEKKAEAADGDDAEKSDYDYLLGMNLWSLTFEKVEEIKKQEEVKKQELDVLKKTTIETMWDRDLEAFIQVLGDEEEREAVELAQADEAAQGRKKKVGSRPAATQAKRAAPKARSGKRAADDDMDFSKPVQEVSLDSEVTKTTWGSGSIAERKPLDPSEVAARAASNAPAPKARKQRAAAEPEPPQEPVKEETGSGLLSRLLSSKSSGVGSAIATRPRPLTSSLDTSFSSSFALSSDDIFGYLKTGSSSDSAPFSALDSLPPALAGDSDKKAAEEDEAEAETATPSKTGGGKTKGKAKSKVPGRGSKAADDDDDDEEKPAKKAKK